MGFGIVERRCELCGRKFTTMEDLRIIYCVDCYLEMWEPDDDWGGDYDAE